MARWERWENSELTQWERWEGNEVAIWERGRVVSREGGMEFKDKVVFNWSREAECKQGFTAGILLYFGFSNLPPSCDKKRKRENINASTLKKSKRQRFEPNLFISNNFIADALQVSESDVEESDRKLMDLFIRC